MLTTVVGSLAVVLGAFFAFLWITRRAGPQGTLPLPSEAVESLGRAPLAGRQQMQLLRVGRKLVLLSVTATDARTLTEITDPDEVDRLAGLCQQTRPGSVTSTFRHVLAQCAGEPASRRAASDSNRPASHRTTTSPLGRPTPEQGHA
jgi:flagellar biogenesis protein FliO